MLGQYSETHLAALNGLLHDIGKPVVRLLFAKGWDDRVIEGVVNSIVCNALKAGEIIEREREGLRELAKRLFNAAISGKAGREYAHEAVFRRLLELLNLTVSEGVSRVLDYALRIADQESASERLGVSLQIARLNLTHHASPFLSPFALLNVLGFFTHDAIAIGEDIDSLHAYRLHERCRLSSSSKCKNLISRKLQELAGGYDTTMIEKLKELPAWHPVRPIRWRTNVTDYYARPLQEALKHVDYVSVNASLLAGLYRLLTLAGLAAKDGVQLDLIEPLTALYRRALLFVPSAVYGGPQQVVLPEISLYAHSRVVAAFTAALYESTRSCGKPCYKLLMLDLMGIQHYITSHRTVTAAVRAFRGRSLVVELVQRAAVNYVLARLGLPWSSVYTYEGGVASIIVPCCISLDQLIDELEEAFHREFHDRLGIAAAYTREVDFKPDKTYSRYRFDPNDPESFTWIVGEAALELAARKAKIGVKGGRLKAYDPEELAYDPFMEENIDVNSYVRYNDVQDDEYWRRIAGDEGLKLVKEAGGVSLDTHRALVAGTAAPNLEAIVEVYLRGCDASKSAEFFRRAANKLFGHEAKRYTLMSLGGARYRLALIDFPSLRAGYILVSIDQPERDRSPWPAIISLLQLIASIPRDGCRLRIVVTRVNYTEDFLPPLQHARRLLEVARKLGAELAFDWIALNTRYPVKQVDGGIMLRGLDETAETGLVALVKMDGDNMGNVMQYMSSAPSRLATASEIVSLVFGLLGYKLLESDNEVREKIYVVYMGGDDAVFFGDLPAALRFALNLEELYTRMLPGMTVSGGAAVEDVKLPLYIAYTEAAQQLEKAKKEPVILAADEYQNPSITLQGNIAVGQMTRPASLCAKRGSRLELLSITSLKWRGSSSLQKVFKLAESFGEYEAKAARILVELADTMSTAIEYRGCSVDSVEIAEALINYVYTKERLRNLSNRDILPELLEKTGGIRPNYPPQGSSGALQARLRLYLALLLSRNPLNIAYQIYRIKLGMGRSTR